MTTTDTLLYPAELILSLFGGLSEEIQAVILNEPCMKYPLVTAAKPFAKMIQDALIKRGYFDVKQGKFIRTKITQGRVKLGPMGTISRSYINIMVAGYRFQQSHLIYLWFTGCLPKTNELIDHIDGDKLNDCPYNLRLISNIFNSRNQKMHCNNSSGYTGVCQRYSGKFESYVGEKGKIHIGYYDTAKEAYSARQAWLTAHPELGFTARHGM